MGMIQDQYRSFVDLRRSEREGVDFNIVCLHRDSRVAIIAPHGGWIEPGTSQIANAIAGNTHSLYCFEGLRNRLHRDLHITSHRFNEPQCLELVGVSDQVIAIHGCAGREQLVQIGGLDEELGEGIRGALDEAGFAVTIVAQGPLAARNRNNICNRGRRGAGVQLEISRCLRDALVPDTDVLERFASAVRRTL